MLARIYRPAKTAMQSGKAGTESWVLDYIPQSPKSIEPLMGYTSSGDMRQQVRLNFETKEDAVAFAKREKIPYQVVEDKKRQVRGASYSDNFRFDRLSPWTH
ncbi:ETC complex I subunit [Flexibacterium corallicola]|uniref:ETC complex I subunit n=1 Tax=Flexibacterium corallicola TaxID=3037259 RepID=UPI00286EFDF9|nr:ETC complex I subunit [Pseudovibrio sp. M1P-2-3]